MPRCTGSTRSSRPEENEPRHEQRDPGDLSHEPRGETGRVPRREVDTERSFVAAQLIQMVREDEADARAIDAELDAQEAEAAAAATGLATVAAPGASDAATGPGGTAVTSEVGQSAMQRPWWETDSRFADRFRALDE